MSWRFHGGMDDANARARLARDGMGRTNGQLKCERADRRSATEKVEVERSAGRLAQSI